MSQLVYSDEKTRVEFLLSHYIAVRTAEASPTLKTLRAPPSSKPRSGSTVVADCVAQNGPQLLVDILPPVDVETASQEEKQLLAVAKSLREISKSFEDRRALQNIATPAADDLSVSEILQQLQGRVDTIDIAKHLASRLTPDNLDRSLEYIRQNSEGHEQIALVLDLMFALNLIRGASSVWPWVKDSFVKYVLRNTDTKQEIDELIGSPELA